ncbi:MAG: class I SAM-dependent methyltransferase [Bacteroidales bacterium]|nr:class I SAM-dependent methyltransferase [Bacteroidales bacterium]
MSKLRTYIKESGEIFYWKIKKIQEKRLTNTHYEYFYTEYFHLSKDFFKEKKILDIGCGPRGSLEWADMTSERVGLDPLADKYLRIGANNHKMKYVKAQSESIPFNDNYFDVVCSFNSIDHVEDLISTCKEIKRILKSGAVFLLIVDMHKNSQICEPQSIDWDFVKNYFSEFEIVEEHHYEKYKNRIFQSIRNNIKFDHQNKTERFGVLTAKLIKS